MQKVQLPLKIENREFFKEYGYLYVEDFYPTSLIDKLKHGIRKILTDICIREGVSFDKANMSDDFDSELSLLFSRDRNLVSSVYDAVKKIPECIQLACHQNNENVASFLLETERPGFCPRGWGLRMDNPSEDKYLTQLHQDFSSQMTSPSGIVYWTPLREVTDELGPLKIYVSSHKEGIAKLKIKDSGSQGLVVADEKKYSKYESILAKCKPGDVIILDFLTMHQSSPNRSNVTRWSMLTRYFDFNEPVGLSIGWSGGLQEDNSFQEFFPDLVER